MAVEYNTTIGGKGNLAIRVMMMPRDTNAHGTIFGGVILSYIDQAGAIEGMRHTPHRLVTVAMNKIEFHEPVRVGDVCSFYAAVEKTGRTSITIRIKVEADRADSPGTTVPVTTATIVYVATDEYGKPILVYSEPPPDEPLNYVI